MAAKNSTDGLAVLEESPQAFGDVLFQFRVCHDLCVYTDNKILDKQIRDKIDQCAVDFRHMSLQTATLSDQVSSAWCRTCILFFENLSKIKGDPSKVLQTISDQAKDLSEGFKGLASWCRKLAGSFHDVQALSKSKSEEYTETMKKAKEKAEKAMKELQTALDKAVKAEEEALERTNRWAIAAMIPVVNLVALPGAVVTAIQHSDAEEARREADKKRDEAERELQKATSNEEKAKIMAEQICVLLRCLNRIEGMCEAIAAFWQMESDRFASFCTAVKTVSDFIELGLEGEVVQNQVDWLKERKTELDKYHKVMSAINAAYNFPTVVKPTEFPCISLPTLNVTLQ